ncbi:dienelactone hydrolase [Flavobacteriaceae bacterium MAR_2010_105]|nr:dienelactone hydrolase [Flavobacteriaceae bacterium MAR_2010_105]
MKTKYQQLRNWLKRQIERFTPGPNAVKGAALGLFLTTALLWFSFALIKAIAIKDGWVLVFAMVIALLVTLITLLLIKALKIINNLPRSFKLAVFICLPLLFMMSFGWLVPVFIVIVTSLVGAAIRSIKRTGFKNLTRVKKVVVLAGLLIGLGGGITLIALYIPSGFEVDPIENAALYNNPDIAQLKVESPSKQGPYKVKTLTYGSGKDKHRPEYGDEVSFKTDSVDGLAFLDNWEGFSGWWRETYWGFDSKSLPINARVWYPDGDGPFPLALVVHGNHGMQDYSDPGYDYLGELLASRGIILASVDQNFINGSWTDIFGGLENENDARGWLLLEHLKQWHQWNTTAGHVFHKKVDTTKLALIGHSRGGEAVAHAALFNKLPFYPDDASVKFDYNYDIKAVIAIAPVDGQYEPGDTRTKFEDVDYFVIHGAQDADVSSYMGSQQYERVKFKDSLYHFKAGLYVYGANHGQFNTSWGNNDTSNPFTGQLNLKQLLSAEDQQEIAKVYISSFLDISLNGKREYLPLFVDARKGRDWLPNTIYLSQFEDSTFKAFASFDEDFDVTTITDTTGGVSTENLTVWREAEINLKWQQKGSRALVVGWDYEMDEDDDELEESIVDSLVASYTIRLGAATTVDSTAVLVFSMAESTESSNPKTEGKWVKDTNNENNLNQNNEAESNSEEDNNQEEASDDDNEEEEKEDKALAPIDFTIKLKDSTGQTVSFPLSKFSALQREIEVILEKTGFLTDEKESEKIFQTFYFPLEDVRTLNPDFDTSSLQQLEFVFDRTKKGVVVIDAIGFMKAL